MELLSNPAQASRWLHQRVRGTLWADSRQVGAGDGFIAWPGTATDGRRFVPAALDQGAAACLVEADGVAAFGFSSDAIAAYPGLKVATGPIAATYFEQPSHGLDVLAVTGTNGKTSIAWWLAQALSNSELNAKIPCGLVGTLGVGRPPRLVSTGMTTPDPVLLQREFRRFADQGLRACAIEASSIGLAERRLDGTRIRVALFTNLTQDHLDYHGTMHDYWLAKAELFRWPGLQAAVVNVDDAHGARLADSLRGGMLDVWTVSCEGRAARLTASDIGYAADAALSGLHFSVAEGGERHAIATQLIGHYNVSNLLCVIGGLRAMGVALHDAVRACTDLLPVPGRMECVTAPGQPLVAIDYAHTPDALDKALAALRPLAAARGGKLWCVFGCGGDRDRAKRPRMGAIAAANADRVTVTSDNPRSEDPRAIIEEILQGIADRSALVVQSDRARAIAETLIAVATADVVLLAGKGHEDYQEIAGVRRSFSDRAEAQRALAARGAGA
ncbi:MAG: UDP-N-acetylmuramoyl-dipeptide--2,6-diaminopimelate ligase [Burkholderiaceae bacterium]|jgi:UDP-N-acetylmuramoyl-L-alanyl-D-glutamate--2,6-diaminopimelate ligase|nr:MAG: UDP-N-acetylmuramoyl-dipeptide--2,6-diaminopimelate ligase [Burkholderiaceae bacterium]